jgi:hypothetical protein
MLSDNGFIGEDNLTLKQHFLNQTKAQWKPKVQSNGSCNDLGLKTGMFVTERFLVHTAVSRAATNPSR